MTDAYPYLLVCRTPTRAGAGQRATDVIDLPLQREAHTNLPVIYGSTLKGALRHATLQRLSEKLDRDTAERLVDAVYGDRPGEGSPSPGAIAVSDAVLLALPVRCDPGFLAWITCPYQLGRLYELLQMTGKLDDLRRTLGDVLEESENLKENHALAPEDDTLVLDRIKVRAKESDAVEELAGELSETAFEGAHEPHFRRYVRERLVIVGDDAFADLANTCTERVVRVQLDENKTVEHGPWYEERVPEGTLFFGTLNVKFDTVPPGSEEGVNVRKVLFEGWDADEVPDGDDPKLKALRKAAGKLEAGVLGSIADGKRLDLPFQVGGSETVGFGLVRMRIPGV